MGIRGNPAIGMETEYVAKASRACFPFPGVFLVGGGGGGFKLGILSTMRDAVFLGVAAVLVAGIPEHRGFFTS